MFETAECLFFNMCMSILLQVPQHYRLMGYQPHNVHEASTSYVSPKLSNPLRTGAEVFFYIIFQTNDKKAYSGTLLSDAFTFYYNPSEICCCKLQSTILLHLMFRMRSSV